MENYDLEAILDMYDDDYVREPRPMMAGGGQLVQPSADGSRPGYNGKGPGSTFAKNINKEFNLAKVNELREKGKTIDEIAKAFNSTKSRYEAFVTLNKNKLVDVNREKQMGKGAFSLAELNRVARIKYPKIGNYAKLNNNQKANVRSNLQYSSVAGTKITKKTFLTPLTEIQQNKILAEFPDADFSKGKLGFSRDDGTNVARVKAFIKRGYKPRFKSLPLKVQNDIKEKFSEIKNWDFKKYKYGIPQTFKASENRKIAMRIKNFVADPKPYKLGFSTQAKGGWMVQQMYRAWEHGNTDYEPIYNKNDKVIGMKEKGKAYYANENVAPSKKFKLINSHPEFNKVQKFVDVANEAKLPLKDLGGYKNTKSLMALFPEGYESVKFSDLVNYLYKEQGADITRNAIEKHHLKNISDMGAPVESKNLQLLRQDLNTLGNTITQQIKEGDLSRVGDLEKAGVKITVDGKTYGKGFQDPRKQMNVIIGETTKKIQSLDKKQMANLLKKFEARGCGLAAGGRILFSDGTPDGKPTKCAQKGIAAFIDDLKKGNYSKATMNILKGGGNLVKNILNPMELVKLRNYLGPTALGFMAAFEAGVITDDVIRQGTPLNESLAQNWLTKSFLPYTEQYAKAKNLLESGKVPSNMKKYVQDVVTFNEMLMDMKGIEGRKESRLLDVGDYGKIDGTSMYTKEQEAKDEADLMKKAKTLTENVFTPGSAKELEMKALQNEMEATRMAKKGFRPFNLFTGFGFDKLKDVRTPPDTGIQDYLPDEKPKDLRPITYMDAEYEDVKKLPDTIRKQYEDFFSSEEGKNLLKPRQSLSELPYGADSTIYDELLKDYNAFQRQKVASQFPGYYGANEKFSEGGIASLKNKKPTNTQKLAKVYKNPGFKYWAVPPKKGPLSKGLKVPPKQVKKV